MGQTQLGRMQFRIMQVLWDLGRASAREISDALNAAEPVAHSTVQTLLRHSRPRGRSATRPAGAPSSSLRGSRKTGSNALPPATCWSEFSAGTSGAWWPT